MSPKTPITVSRKREKRKQQKLLLLDDLLSTRSPEQLIEQAVKIDELHHSESILREPLESVRLYDTEMFIEALQYLRDYRPTHDLPSSALAPIVVSGLLSSALQRSSADVRALTSSLGNATTPTHLTSDSGISNIPPSTVTYNDTNRSTLSPDLVLQFQSMRTAAIYRLRHRARRSQQLTLLLFSVATLLLAVAWYRVRLYWRSRVMKHSVSSCDAMPAYAPACRQAEAAVWWKRQFDGSSRSVTGSKNTRLHTTLERDLISWEEVEDPIAAKSKTVNRKYANNDSIVYKLVLESLLMASQVENESEQLVLDVGCGVGGLSHVVPSAWKYHGVSASSLEIDIARQNAKANAYFYQQSFDRSFPAKNYTAAFAIDSLTFSRHLGNTLERIVSSLAPGGVLIVVDDVIDTELQLNEGAGNEAFAAYRPSLVSHSHWMTSLAASGCKVTSARDLSAEYQIHMDHELSLFLSNWRVLGAVFSIDLTTVFEKLHLTNNPESQRLMELVDELNDIGQYWKDRRQGFELSSQLYYHMYLCRKE